MNWSVIYARRATRELRNLDASAARRIVIGIERLASGETADIRRLRGSRRDWRLRVGDLRVIFEYHRDSRTIYIKRIGNRGDIY